MIIVKLMGGIGNQMFQYAAARRLAHIHDTPLKLDLSWFSSVAATETVRNYELDTFAIKKDLAMPEEVEKLKTNNENRVYKLGRRFVNAIAPFYQETFVREKYYHFDPDILKLSSNVYLEGYWHSEKYFKDIEKIIRKEFKVGIEPGEMNRQLAEAIDNTESVSIHVRRGDYVSNPITSQFHGTCTLDYYREAVGKITSQAQHAHFFVFSDDPAWVKENLGLVHPATYLDFNGPDKAYEDLRLMSLCKHHIIANSSFSWWGAWLGTNHKKIVFAPKRWFNNTKINTMDLLPDSWVKI